MLRKRLSLILDNVDEQCPADIAYVHSVYAPLSVSHPFNLRKFTSFFKKVRLVQQLDKPGWRNMRDVLDLLPGPSFEDTQQVAAESRPRSQGGPKVPRWTFQFWKYKLHFFKVVMVMFIGGCTMAEVAALRFLSQQVRFSDKCLGLHLVLLLSRRRTMWSTWWSPPPSSLESPSLSLLPPSWKLQRSEMFVWHSD